METANQRTYGNRARIGLVVPSTNTVAETEFWRLVPADVTVHTSRMPFFAGASDEPLAVMEQSVSRVLEEATSAQPTIIAYGCTASSAVGNALDKQAALAAKAQLQTVTAAAALLAALAVLEVSRVVLLTPYPQAVNDKEIKFFAANDIDVIADESILVSAAQQEMREMYKVPTAKLLERAVALGSHPDAQAVVLSCCDMPTLDAIDVIEQRIGKPVISSTQALFWYALRTSGLDEAIPGAGRLLASH